MPWYAWLLIIALAIGCVVLVIVLLTRKKVVTGLSDSEKKKLLEIETGKLNDELRIEKEKQAKLRLILKAQAERLAVMEKWYEASKSSIAKSKREDFEKYLRDTKSAGTELDKLLGISTDDTQREKP